MTQEERNNTITLLKNFESINIKDIFIDRFKSSESDINSKIVLGSYTVQELINTTEKIVANFNRELNLSGWSSLSNHAVHQELGNRNLQADITNLFNQINNKQIDETYLVFLNWLIFYQRTNNFWHLTNSTISLEKAKELENTIETKDVIYNQSIKDFTALKTEAENVKSAINKLIEDKTNELNTLAGNISSTNTTLSEINQVLNDGKSKNELLSTIVKQTEEKSDEAKERIEEERKKFEIYKNIIEELEKDLHEKIEASNQFQKKWEEKFSFIEGKETYIIQKEKEINDLTGFAAGVSLFHTFQERKKELDRPVKNWFWGLIWSAILTVAGVIVIFLVTPSAGDWSIFALNTLKSFPFFILLYFSIRQYSKERAIQEEYAFKSAVALTLNAFADKISEGGISGKDKLILSSVDKIYEVPNVMKEKGGSLFSFRTKPLNDVLKNLTDAVKEVKK